MIVEVIINNPNKELNKQFDYLVPTHLEDKILLGKRVEVPFGLGNRVIEGYIINIKEDSNIDISRLKALNRLLDEFTIYDENLLVLAKWMSKTYFCNLSECIKTIMPSIGNIKTQKIIILNDDYERILADTKIKSMVQNNIIEELKRYNRISYFELRNIISSSTLIQNLKRLEKLGIVKILEQEVERSPLSNKNIMKSYPFNPTEEQEIIIKNIEKSLVKNKFEEILLNGVTGSGKTEVYLQLIQRAIEQDKQAIVLVPEISLTPLMIERFVGRFGDRVSVLHSRLSIGEKYDQWRKIKNNEASVVIGPRSAIFAPCERLGVVIIDEEHDQSYKSDNTPKYHVRDIARKRCQIEKSILILGSATPDISTFYRAKSNEITYYEMNNRTNKKPLPAVEIIDMRQELANGNKSMFSQRLREEIAKNLEKKEQTILFLNRRGYSTFIICRSCGFVMKCRNCNIALTYHMNKDSLICHYCGYSTQNPTICPVCKSNYIRHFGTGTQKIEEEIKKIFPQASVVRMDLDTTTGKDGHEKILNRFKNEKIDILIGTQMVSKGHDFHNVTLVGVMSADTTLNIDDYRATERTFQLLTQVSGRAGRGELSGRSIIQTYESENYSIILASNHDYKKFYEQEILLRKQLNYPPFCDIISYTIMGENESEVINTSHQLFDKMKYEKEKFNLELTLLGPNPAPLSKIKNNYRWRIIIKMNSNNEILDILQNIIKQLQISANIKIGIDFNPLNML